jgi:N-acyl-D-amino-acid deacylase
MASFDVIIKNGTVYDGVSSEPRLLDIGISGKEIKAIDKLSGANAGRIIEADSKFVTPGFVDIQNHSDSYLTLLEIPSQDSLVAQGITTVAVGQCGTSLAPLVSPEALKSIQKWHSLAGANLNWLTFEEYFRALKDYPLGVNVLSLVGHSTMRRGLLRDEVRPATKEEILIMERLLRESLEAGAAGCSLGLVYAHEVDTGQEELLSVAKIIGEHQKLLSVHLRSEGRHVIDAINEVVEFGQVRGAKFKISHFKVRGKQNWPAVEEALAILDRAYQKGVDIFFDVYPYTTSWTVLYTYLPKWAYEGGRQNILQNIKNPATREKILAYLKSSELNLAQVFIATSETNSAFIGKNLAEISANQEISIEQALLNVLAATQAQVIAFDHNLSEDVLEILLKHPLSIVGSDGAGYDYHFSPAHGLIHPRCFGTFPKFLQMVREKKIMTWDAAIRKITSRPAEKLGLHKRGVLKPGNFADIVVFDPYAVGSPASYENPYQEPDGIDYVFVNGKLAYQAHGEQNEQAGEILRI